MSEPSTTFWERLPLGSGVEVLTHDANGVAALSKPAGLLSHPNIPGEEPRSLLNAPYALDGEFYQWTPAEGEKNAGVPQRLYLLNRLDSATSGVILVAADEALATSIRATFKRKQVRKIYNALVFGQPSQAAQIWRDMLVVKKQHGQIRTGTGGNIHAKTQMGVLRQRRHKEPFLALLKLEPHTGRSHQLRVQCAQRHLPVVGDATYGDFRRNREFIQTNGIKRLFLHSLQTSFDYEWSGGKFYFTAIAPLPAEFHKFMV